MTTVRHMPSYMRIMASFGSHRRYRIKMALLKTSPGKELVMYKTANISDYHSTLPYVSKGEFFLLQVLV